MSKTSSVITAGVTMSAATLAPLVGWAMNGFPKPIPPDVPLLIAAGLISAGHAAYNLVSARLAASAAPITPDPLHPSEGPAQ